MMSKKHAAVIKIRIDRSLMHNENFSIFCSENRALKENKRPLSSITMDTHKQIINKIDGQVTLNVN